MFRKKNYLAPWRGDAAGTADSQPPPRVNASPQARRRQFVLPLFGLANTTQQLPADLATRSCPAVNCPAIENLHTTNEARKFKLATAAARRENKPARRCSAAAAGAVETQARTSSCATRPTGGAPCRLTRQPDGLREKNWPVLTADGLVGRFHPLASRVRRSFDWRPDCRSRAR